MTLAPSTRRGPYEIVAPLGAGGMGEVYRARDLRLGREGALAGNGAPRHPGPGLLRGQTAVRHHDFLAGDPQP